MRKRDRLEPLTVTEVEDMAAALGVEHDPLLQGLHRQEVPINEPSEADRSDEVAVICDGCGANFSDTHKFCPECGNPTRAITRGGDTDLRTRVTALEQRLSSIQTGAAPGAWRWVQVREGEKWRVWWGVAWRGLVVYGIVWITVDAIVASMLP